MRIEVEIVNALGLHARPAAEFVRCARKFASEITVHKAGEVFSATSIMEVLTANLDCGARIQLEAMGPDAAVALNRLAALLLRFREDEQRGQ